MGWFIIFFHFFVTFLLTEAKAVIAIPDLATAQAVAQGIASELRAAGGTKLEGCVDNSIITTHSNTGHPAGKSYFVTDDRAVLINIANEIITGATTYDIRTVPNLHGDLRKPLEIRKTFTDGEAAALVGYNHIGYRGDTGAAVNRAKLIFDITDVNSPADYHLGGAITGFPY